MQKIEFDGGFEVEDLGLIEQDVYDIEVEDNHNFFGNGICVHNSIYVEMKELVDKYNPKNPIDFLDKIANDKMEPVLAAAYDDLFKRMNAFKPAMKMKRECIADKGLWQAKKRYILQVHDNEGVRYAEPKIKIMGIEAIKSNTPKVCREKMKDCFKIIMNATESDLHAEIAAFKKLFKDMPLAGIAKPSGLTETRKWEAKGASAKPYISGTPQNSKAAIIHNHLVDVKNANVQKIQGGDRMWILPLLIPNPIGENVIAFIDKLPSEFEIGPYIDFNKQFEKAFLEPLRLVLNPIGWHDEPRATLDFLFD